MPIIPDGFGHQRGWFVILGRSPYHEEMQAIITGYFSTAVRDSLLESVALTLALIALAGLMAWRLGHCRSAWLRDGKWALPGCLFAAVFFLHLMVWTPNFNRLVAADNKAGAILTHNFKIDRASYKRTRLVVFYYDPGTQTEQVSLSPAEVEALRGRLFASADPESVKIARRLGADLR
jgi:hypothetical protein